MTLPTRLLLAPLHGITDAGLRRAVAETGGVGAVITDFVRLSVAVPGAATLRTRLGPQPGCPQGMQFMATGPALIAGAVRAAAAAGADFIDLNFGCPAPRVLRKAAGSGLLAHLDRLAAIATAAVTAAPVPVTAKIRCGLDDTAPLLDVLDALAAAGVALITVHGRLACEPYTAPACWERIAVAVRHLAQRRPGLPVCGNGDVRSADDARRLVRETGCQAVMVGRGALGDPFLLRAAALGRPATPAERSAWFRTFLAEVAARRGPAVALMRGKQSARHALGLDETCRHRALHAGSLDELLTHLAPDGAPGGLAISSRSQKTMKNQ